MKVIYELASEVATQKASGWSKFNSLNSQRGLFTSPLFCSIDDEFFFVMDQSALLSYFCHRKPRRGKRKKNEKMKKRATDANWPSLKQFIKINFLLNWGWVWELRLLMFAVNLSLLVSGGRVSYFNDFAFVLISVESSWRFFSKHFVDIYEKQIFLVDLKSFSLRHSC